MTYPVFLPRPLRAIDIRVLGPYRLEGTVKSRETASDVPVRRRVRLHDQFTGAPLLEVWSAAITGVYAFESVRAGTFYVVSLDHTGQYSGVIETDIVLPAP